MKKLLLIVAIPLVSYIGHAQVGINNTDPKASLDITASNATNPSNTDGILIPRIEDFPGVNPTADQQGMMVYLTTTSGSNPPGYYYWDNNAGPAAWVSVNNDDHDWYQENSTSPPSTNGADIFTDGNVGIGISNVNYPLQIESSSASRTVSLLNENTGSSLYGFYNRINESSASSGSTNGILNSITRTNQGSVSGVSNSFSNSEATQSFGYLYGYQNSFGNSTSTTTFGLLNRFQGTTGTAYGISNLIGYDITDFYGVDNHNISGANLTGTFYGVYNSLTGSDAGDRYGIYTNFAETGNGDKYGEYINIATSAGGTHYGVYSDVRKSNSYAGYFLGRTSFGTGTTNRYLMPATDGTNGQVIVTNGAGQLSFSSVAGVEKVDDLSDGKSDSDGSNDGSSIFLGASAGAGDDSSDNRNVGVGYETFLTNTTAGLNVAVGYQALRDVSVGGNDNTAVGYQSMMLNTSGYYNTAFGIWSLYSNSTGLHNTSIGARSLISHTNGSRNTVLGYNAGELLTSGSGNVLIGYDAAGNTATLNDRLFIDNSSTPLPLIYGEFDNDILRTNGEFQIGNPSGSGYAFPTVDSTNGYVLQTNGAGQLSFVNPTSIDDGDWVVSGGNVLRNSGNVLVNRVNQNYKLSLGGYSIATKNSYVDIAPSNSQADAMIITTNYDTADGLSVSQNSSYTLATRSAITTYTNRGGMTANLGYYSNVPSSRSIGLYVTNPGSTSDTYGVLYEVNNTTNTGGDRYGLVADIDIDGSSGNYYGVKSDVEGTGSSVKYGVYTKVTAPSSVGYGLYSDVQSSNDYAAYLIGRTSLGLGTSNRYLMPSADGTNGQVMTTDGSGNLSFTTLNNEDHDWYEEGTTTAPNAITDDIYTQGNVGIGVSTVSYPLQIETPSSGRSINILNNSNGSSVYSLFNTISESSTASGFTEAVINSIRRTNQSSISGVSNSFSNSVVTQSYGYLFGYQNSFGNSTSSTTFGLINRFQGTTTTGYGVRNFVSGTFTNLYGLSNYNSASDNLPGTFYGLHNTLSGNSQGARYGVYTSFEETGSGTKYGEYINIASTAGGTHYGIYSDVRKSNSYAGYFLGRSSFGIGTSNRYLMPTVDGTANQVITTDGSGQLSFTTLSNNNHDWYEEGTTNAPNAITDDIYTQGNVAIGKTTAASPLDIEVTGTPSNLIALKIVDNSTGTGDHVGIQQTLSGSHNETTTGLETYVTNSGNGLHTGISTSVQNGTGNQVGNRTTLNGFSGTNAIYSGSIFNSGSASSNTQSGVNISIQQPTSQISYGTFNTLNASGTSASGTKYGIYNLIDGGTGNHFGVYNDVRGTGSNTKYGTYNLFGIGTTNTGGILYGTYNSFGNSITSTSDKYGNYTLIPSGLSGTHYGTYNDVSSSNGWAGYFVGRNYISDRLSIGETDNADASLSINANSTGTLSHIELKETTANDGARIRFTNTVETNNEWVLYARADNTAGQGAFNIYSSEIASNVIRVESDGKVGIMRNPTTNQLEVGGTASKAAAGSWLGNSDSRLKKNIQIINGTSALYKINQLRGVTYEWDDTQTGMKRPEGIQYGFIAQELMKVFPEKVTMDNQGFYQTAYGDYDALFVQAIKELNSKVEDLESENQQLKSLLSKYEDLEARLSALEEKPNATIDVANNK